MALYILSILPKKKKKKDQTDQHLDMRQCSSSGGGEVGMLQGCVKH